MTALEYEYVRRHPRRHASPATAHAAWRTTAPHEIPEYVDARIAEERAQAVTRAVRLLVEGRRGFAHFVMARSFLEQLRLAGIHPRRGDVSPKLSVIDPFLGRPSDADHALAVAMGYTPDRPPTSTPGGAA